MPAAHDELSEPMFRASKRRKIVRRRIADDDGDAEDLVAATPPPADVHASAATSPPVEPRAATEEGLSIAEILRLRKKGRAKRPGVEFASHASTPPTTNSHAVDESPIANNTAQAILDAASSRFAPQTGKVADELDKHMMAYIDSKMAEISEKTSTTNPTSTTSSDIPRTASEPKSQQAAGQGKLMEVDLGPSSTQRNIALTEAARQRLEATGQNKILHNEARPPKPRPGLGPDGKPWRPRKRRGSDDLRRDALVEAILSESRLAKYSDASPLQPSSARNDDGQAADDRIAEQFQRDFLEAVQNRNKKAQPPPPSSSRGAAAKGTEDKNKGPKLGGSRSARAAMAARQAAEEKARKK